MSVFALEYLAAFRDQFLHTQEETTSPETGPHSVPASPEMIGPSFLEKCLPQVSENERHGVSEMLQTEYIHLLPLVQLGLAAATGAVKEEPAKP